jgi:transposase-like protein/IS1 family transposase
MQNQTEPMDASKQFCPNEACSARGKIGEGNIRIHCYQPQRYRCQRCKKTFSARRGTVMEGLRTPAELLLTALILLSYGCPKQAIVHAFGVDERTVAQWQQRAGTHCHQVHQALVEQGRVDLQHVQADEIRVKGCQLIAWMGLAIEVSTRLWLAGVVSPQRDTALADQLLRHVRACCQAVGALLVCTDGWASYPNSIKRAFREKVKKTAGRGRACLEVWPELCIATLIKHVKNKHLVQITRKMTLGTLQQAQKRLEASRGGTQLNTSFIERFNGTMRERLACLTRKCRHAAHRLSTIEAGMYLIGCTYNWCFAHQELSSAKHRGHPCTPAMAAGLTDHLWSVAELLLYKVAPPAWVAPKGVRQQGKASVSEQALPKRPPGRPRKHPLPDPTLPKRPRGRPRKVA